MQETLARGWRYRASFALDRDLLPWLRQCALRVWLTWRRSADRAPTALGDRSESIHDPRTDGLDAREELARAVAPLRAIERTLLLHHHRDRFTVRELAARFGLAENTVKSHLRRARNRLARPDHDL